MIDIENIADYSGFSSAEAPQALIKVVGVGGGGNNAVDYMYGKKVEGVTFVQVNTDRDVLAASPVPAKVLLGNGLGAGNHPEVGREKAETDKEKIEKIFEDGTKMVFITACMGGGTGTGAAPIVARVAQEKGVLSVGIITIPFMFERATKIKKALEGAMEMRKHVDALLVINNEELINNYPDMTISQAFAKADDVLATATISISDLVTYKGKWNLDFEDVKTTLQKGGAAIISTGRAKGAKRLTNALQDALNSPLLKKHDVFSAKRLLINLYSNPEVVKMAEMREFTDFMSKFSNDLDPIIGQTHDKSLGDEVRITVLATGFEINLEDVDKPIMVANSGAPFMILPREIDDEEVIKAIEDVPTYGRITGADESKPVIVAKPKKGKEIIF